MIYTVGQRDTYERYRSEQGDEWQKLGRRTHGLQDGGKYDRYFPGGSVWQTYSEAQRVADLNPGFSVYGVDAEWGWDTEASAGGPWHDLLRDARLISLEDAHATGTGAGDDAQVS